MKLMVKVTLFLFLVILVIMIPAVTLIWQNQHRTLLEQAHVRAQTIHKMIIITRQWVAENRDRIEPVPAVATKELSEYAATMATFRFHITSDKLVNLDNAPTEFEIEAMEEFKKKGLLEFSKISTDDEFGSVYLYAAPLFINESCMQCHSNQHYEINDFRGLLSIRFPLADLEKSLSRHNNIILYTMIVGLFAIVIMVSLLIHWLVMRHLNTLTNATIQIKQGNMVQTNIKTDDEIQSLSEAFDQMSQQIAFNEETLTAKLNEAVGKYVALVDELKEKNEILDSVNQLKTELLDSIAHEIRTPLTKILSYSELLNDERLINDVEMRSKFAANMKNNINTIKNMFTDIITLSRLEHGQYIYHPIQVNLHNLILETVDIFELEIKSKNLDIKIDMDKTDIVYVDGETFSSVITNIISNACKYSKPNNEVIIRAYRENGNYIISCKDFGVGIPKDDIDKILLRFHRGANVKKEYPGTGLGLSIVARIVKAHNGTIKIDSIENEFTEILMTFNAKDILENK